MAVRFKILTLFKEAFESYLNASIIKRGIEAGSVSVDLIDFREYSTNKHRKVDDTTYGGGPGMLLTCQPLYDAIEDVKEEGDMLIFLTPNGKLLDQKAVIDFAEYDSFVLVCGRYEGFDARIFSCFDHIKLSIGDYVLTGGELPAMIFLDAVSRYKDILHNKGSLDEESFSNGLLEYDQYTKPAQFKGLDVPEVLMNGHHAKIQEFRHKSSIKNTLINRPDLLIKKMRDLSDDDLSYIKLLKEELSFNDRLNEENDT